MLIQYMKICNFKSIREIVMDNVENALILVGRNSVGKTVVLDALRAVEGSYKIKDSDFNYRGGNISVSLKISINDNDLHSFNKRGMFSRYKRFDLWLNDFCNKFPSFDKEKGIISFTYIVNQDKKERFEDGYKKNNQHIRGLLPKIHYISTSRDVTDIQRSIFESNKELESLKSGKCVFDAGRECTNTFQCIGVINKKKPEELTVHETQRLLHYKLMLLGFDKFMERFNYHFHKNGPQMENIEFAMDMSFSDAFNPTIYLKNNERGDTGELADMSAGMKSIYILSMLETYIEMQDNISSIILIEDPEMYLHPQLQKVASEILYRLSKKNQVMFSTHSPNLIFNFNSRQIKQIVLDKDGYTTAREDVDIDEILNDLGFSANDLMNVSFVFIVEGKQDKARLPLLLEKYYSEVYDDEGNLSRVAIISTNSCTNIKTYANLKYMNSVYIKDQFLMIRDGDGKDPRYLKNQLCNYYTESRKRDNAIPRVTDKNVLILKYYSFENYFLEPKVMAAIGVIPDEEAFYDILYSKYKEYLYKLSSVRKMLEREKISINSKEDIKENMELIKIYVRGHNLYDIFYGRYKKQRETEILKKYIDLAPRDTFKDILDTIDGFVYFESKKS